MSRLSFRYKVIILGIIRAICGWSLFAYAQIPRQKGFSPGSSSGKPGFARKNCLDCHKTFVEKYMGMKNIHPMVKEKKCEDCHLRHGLVGKLILKKEGNEVCYPCHSKEKGGFSKKNVHTALSRGKCIACHDPHASQASRLLKGEGNQVCFQCHKKA